MLDNEAKNKVEGPSCPVTGRDLGRADVIENSVRVGDKTILFMPSFRSTIKLHRVSSPIEFRIIETTNLMSLSEGYISCLIWSLTLCCSHGQISLEYNTDSNSHALLLTSPSWYFNTGVIFGTSYFVAPSACNEIETSSEEMNQSELNNQCVRMISFIFVIFWFNCVYVKNFVNYPNSYGF